MSRINTVPVGLQSLLGSQNFGDNPSELSPVTAPVLDLFPFLAAYKIEYFRNSATFTARGQQVFTTVPDGEIWMPISIATNWFGATNVGDFVQVAIELENPPGQPPTSSGIPLFWSDIITATSVGQTSGNAWQPPVPFLLQAGTNITTRCTEISVVAQAFWETQIMAYVFGQ